jgi:hypothetical protein
MSFVVEWMKRKRLLLALLAFQLVCPLIKNGSYV